MLRAQPERPLDEQIEFNSKSTIKNLPLLLGCLWHIPIIKLAFSVRQDRKYYTIAAQYRKIISFPRHEECGLVTHSVLVVDVMTIKSDDDHRHRHHHPVNEIMKE